MTKPRERAPEGPLRFLPSAMTVLAICLGLTAIKYALDGRPTEAMALIAAAAILDALDGRMARVLNATSKMGEEIDSLADAINFGVAPAFIVYALLLQDTRVGWIVVLLYAVCIVLRLARYNALLDADLPAYTKQYFVGMPAPAGAIGAIGPLAAQDAVRRRLVDVVVGSVALDDRGVSAGGQSHPDAQDPHLRGAAAARRTAAGAAGHRHRGRVRLPLPDDPGDHRRLRLPHPVRGAQQGVAGRTPGSVGRQAQGSNGRRGAQSAGRIPADAPRRPGGRRPDFGYGGPEVIHESTFAHRPAEHLGDGLAPRSGPPAPRSRCSPGHPGMGCGFADRLAHHVRGGRPGRVRHAAGHRTARRRDAVQRRPS